jgi:hypothetical protein
MKTKQELKQFFENGDIPKQEEFWDWQESYWHKDEKIPLDKVAYDFSQKADLVNGVVPTSQLPSYVDDVLEFDTLAGLPQQGESGKIYITKDTNKLYRWTGTRYIDITQGELATLQSVTERGNETTKSINIQGINYGGFSQFNNIIIGEKSEELNSQSDNIIAIGKGTNPLGTGHLVIGHNAGGSNSGSDSNTIIGNFSFRDASDASENTVVGHLSFNAGRGAQSNTVLGISAGNTGGTGIMENIIIGCRAGTELGAESKSNIIIGGNSGFNNTQLQNSLYIHNNISGNPVTLSDALISGNFANRYVNLNGRFSITPDQIPAADATYTKNIVARPDGTFGWENKISSEYIPLTGTVSNKPVKGDIVIKNGNQAAFNYTRLSSGTIFCSDISNSGVFVNPRSITFLESGAGMIGDISLSGISTREDSYTIASNGLSPRGLSGAQDYTSNVKDLDYIQKKYTDRQQSYTKEEVKTGGLWIDNKPIYRKTVVFTHIPEEGIIEIENIFKDMEIIVSNQMYTQWYDMKADFAGNQLRGNIFITLQKEFVQFLVKDNPSYNYSAIDAFTLTLEYTKKSDAPVV